MQTRTLHHTAAIVSDSVENRSMMTRLERSAVCEELYQRDNYADPYL